MTRARRRVVRLALMLKVAGIEPVFMGCRYSEMQANLELQWAGLTPSRRKAVRLQARRLLSVAGGLANAADHLVPRPLQQKTGSEPPIQPSLTQMPPSPPRHHAVVSAGRDSASRNVSFPANWTHRGYGRFRRTRSSSSTPAQLVLATILVIPR
jgi:hypothetical protein